MDNQMPALIRRLRTGNLDFERFIELLTTRGYILECDNEFGFSSNELESLGDVISSEVFPIVFKLLMPGILNDITIHCHATDEGGDRGCFAYGIYNPRIMDYKQFHAVLVMENQRIKVEYEKLLSGE